VPDDDAAVRSVAESIPLFDEPVVPITACCGPFRPVFHPFSTAYSPSVEIRTC
jgi:hypothetical protein